MPKSAKDDQMSIEITAGVSEIGDDQMNEQDDSKLQPSDASSSDLTEGTPVEPAVVTDCVQPPLFSETEANSTAINYCPSTPKFYQVLDYIILTYRCVFEIESHHEFFKRAFENMHFISKD